MNNIITGSALKEFLLTANVSKNATAQTLVSGNLRVDPFLPTVLAIQGQTNPNVSIIKGRFVGIGKNGVALTVSNTDVPTYVTLATSSSVRPLGMSVNNVRTAVPASNAAPTLVNDVEIVKSTQADLPLTSVNASYGVMNSGDAVTAHFGLLPTTINVVGNTLPTIHRDYAITGMPVKWIERRLHNASKFGTSNNSAIQLTAATNRNIVPFIRAISNNGTVIDTGTNVPTLTWNLTNWELVLAPLAVFTDVLYELGQGAEFIAGRVIRATPMAAIKNKDILFKHVKENGTPFSGPLGVLYGESTKLEGAGFAQAPMTVSGQNLALTPAVGPLNFASGTTITLDPREVITVEVQGTVTVAGVPTVYSGGSWYTLPANSFENTTVHTGLVGAYHQVDWTNATVALAGNIVATAARMTARRITTPFTQTWAAGQYGLTNGQRSGFGGGVPSSLDVASGLGMLSIWVD